MKKKKEFKDDVIKKEDIILSNRKINLEIQKSSIYDLGPPFSPKSLSDKLKFILLHTEIALDLAN